ncbi:MAG: permease [Dehalococcoidales bacterium]|nr:permease [Dehalococcoidales bacterium]
MSFFLELLKGGWNGLVEYLSAHVITCLVPALFIAGGIAAFVSQGAILKYFGPSANKWVSYPVAAVSGAVLAVCSCTVLPLFAGIYKKGAGIGPAVAFLFAGPAINVLAIVYSARLLGYDIGLGRAVLAVAFSVLIGLAMALVFRKEKNQPDEKAFALLAEGPSGKPVWQQVLFIGVLVGILVGAASRNWVALGVFLVALVAVTVRWFRRGEVVQWLKETLHFTRLIIPWLLLGVFVAGILTVLIPQDWVISWVGSNNLLASFIASFAGSLMYFATLTEVPIVRAFMELGMGRGPALSLLLAGPALSLPAMFTLARIMGFRKMITYVSFVVIMAALAGYTFGRISG